MPLPWVRLDANIATHPKVLALLAEKEGARAFTLYVCALGYAGAHGTDGHIPKYALTVNHGSEKLARLLVDYALWEYNGDGGYVIRNFHERQPAEQTTQAIRSAQAAGARKANCKRWHTPGCQCWRDT